MYRQFHLQYCRRFYLKFRTLVLPVPQMRSRQHTFTFNHPTMRRIFLLAFLVSPLLVAGQSATGRIDYAGWARAQAPRAIAEFVNMLSLPNDAHFPEHVQQNVAWAEQAFAQRGFTPRRLATTPGGPPLLLCTRTVAGATKTILFYSHMDGQPVDPTRWEQEDPWKPVLKRRTEDGSWEAIPFEWIEQRGLDPEWRIFARSASDDKGPVMMFLAALDAMKQAGVEPAYHIKYILDFEEEQGSKHLPAAVARYKELLEADALIILDGPRHYPSNRPTLSFGARGIATITLTVYGPKAPLHSGHYGNWAPNPAFRLAHLLASMKDEDGRVRIAGFYDGIELSEEVKAMLARVPDDEPRLMQQLGFAEAEKVGATLQEALQYPSLNLRGMASGWVGDEVRTIVPDRAVAEIDIRLVKESDPERLIELVRRHIEQQGYCLTEREPTDEMRQQCPRLCRFESRISYRAFRTDMDSPTGRWLQRALHAAFGEAPVMKRTSGGSIPIAPFVETLGIPAVTVPTVNADNNQHSPNENLRLGNFVEGIQTMLALLTTPVEE